MALSQREPYTSLASINDDDQNKFIEQCQLYQRQGLNWSRSPANSKEYGNRLKQEFRTFVI